MRPGNGSSERYNRIFCRIVVRERWIRMEGQRDPIVFFQVRRIRQELCHILNGVLGPGDDPTSKAGGLLPETNNKRSRRWEAAAKMSKSEAPDTIVTFQIGNICLDRLRRIGLFPGLFIMELHEQALLAQGSKTPPSIIQGDWTRATSPPPASSFVSIISSVSISPSAAQGILAVLE
jgi:hypothetical protein